MIGMVDEFAGGDLATGQRVLQRGEDQVGVRAGGLEGAQQPRWVTTASSTTRARLAL
ncbi:hypothetical protein [Streptomyces sp. NPDC058145]|uniref:hypothetical protein n=1 Tax=Streptomyces sp. NPDC058145 TaxID=3346356 RepID=UPI0036E8CC1B